MIFLNWSVHKKACLAFIGFSFLAFTVFAQLGFLFYIFLLGILFFTLRETSLKKIDFVPLLLFYILPFIYFFVTGIHCLTLDSTFIDFTSSIFGRLLNYFLYMSFYVIIISAFNRKIITTEDILKAYQFGLYILLFFGIWQLFNMLFGIPYPNFNTRTAIHSMDTQSLGKTFSFRVTSLAREPAYLIPYLVDFFIIEFYRKQKKLIVLALIVLLIFFTLSLSGYCNFLIILLTIVLLGNDKRYKILAFILLIIAGSFLFIKFGNVVTAVFTRLNPKQFQSSRAQEAYLPLLYMAENMDLFIFLFGYGTKGLQYVSQFLHYTGIFSGMPFPVTATTHVIFIDFFIDYGFVGLCLLIIFFLFLYKIAKRVFLLKSTRIAQILLLNLFINCVYTSDYASPRFTVFIVLFICFFKATKIKISMEWI